MDILKTINKSFGAIGSVGSLAADAVDGISSLGSKAGISIEEEISIMQYNQRLDNAKERILNKAKHIKEIAETLNISPSEAEELLDKELNNGS